MEIEKGSKQTLALLNPSACAFEGYYAHMRHVTKSHIIEQRHVISNNKCRLLRACASFIFSLETPNVGQSVA